MHPAAKASLVGLKVIGLVIIVAAFEFRNIEDYPWLQRKINPQYPHAKAAITKLRYRLLLDKGDEGFDAFSDIFLTKLAKANGIAKMPQDVRVEYFTVLSSTGIGETWAANVGVEIATKNTRIVTNRFEVPFSEFTQQLEQDRHARIFASTRNLFWCGLLIELIAILVDSTAYVLGRRTKKSGALVLSGLPVEPQNSQGFR